MSNALNLQEIDQEQALNLAKFFIQCGQNIFLFGQRGTGKTEIAMQAAKECNLKINYINLSVIERPDLAGYPDMNAEGDIITYKSPYFLPKLLPNTKPDSIILFDEVDKVSPDITAPLLEILLYKKINGNSINACACILTGNLLNERAYSNELSTALLDRGAKYLLKFNFEKWLDWAILNNIHELILGFLRNYPDYACGKVEDIGYASSSPRGWTNVSAALTQTKKFKMTDIDSVEQIVAGYVGSEAAIKFRIWYEYYRKYEPFVISLIERGDLSLDFNSLMGTEKLVFVISACHYAKQKILSNKSKNKFLFLENLCYFFDKYQVEPEVQTVGLQNSFSFELVREHKLYTCKPFFDHFTKLTEHIDFKK